MQILKGQQWSLLCYWSTRVVSVSSDLPTRSIMSPYWGSNTFTCGTRLRQFVAFLEKITSVNTPCKKNTAAPQERSKRKKRIEQHFWRSLHRIKTRDGKNSYRKMRLLDEKFQSLIPGQYIISCSEKQPICKVYTWFLLRYLKWILKMHRELWNQIPAHKQNTS